MTETAQPSMTDLKESILFLYFKLIWAKELQTTMSFVAVETILVTL